LTERELDRRMFSDEYTNWRAYYSVRPFGERALDLRLAFMLARLAEMVDGKPHKADEFDPFPEPTEGDYIGAEAPQQMDPEHMRSMFKSLTKKMGGEVKSWPEAQ